MDSEQENGSDELTMEPVETPLGAGARLRAAREEKGLELEHVAAETRIPLRHLETIESGSFDDLPSRTYAIGFARTYARTVGLNEKEIADSVRDELSDGYSRQTALAGGMEPGDPGKTPSAGLAWFGAIAALILVIGMVAFYNTYFGAGEGPGSLLAGLSEEETAEGETGAAAAEEAAPAPDAGGAVIFTALEDGIWVRFYEDGGERLLETTMASGDTFEVPATASAPLINTGRPDAFAITIGGQDVPKLADEPITLGDTPVSAEALLARGQEEQSESAGAAAGEAPSNAG